MGNEVKYSLSQKEAIYTEGKTLLVSAGAGSGKTTVLTQRILEHIKNGTDISELLVVTFTKAAAANMKEKLYMALLAESALHPTDVRLTRNVYMIPSARISTIHSFCLDTVKGNFETLSLSPSLRVADVNESAILLDECIEKCIDELFENGAEWFVCLCDAFTGEKSLNKFKETVKTVYSRYRSFPFWKDYIKRSAEKKAEDFEKAKKDGFINSEIGTELRKTAAKHISYAKKTADDIFDTVSVASQKESHISPLELLCESIDRIHSALADGNASYTDIANAFEAYTAKKAFTRGLDPSVAAEYTRMKTRASDAVGKAKRLFASSEADVISDYESSVRLNDLMNRFILTVDEMFSEAKRKRGIIEFPDLEQFTLELLGENTAGGVIRTPLCNELRKTIKEIYIDEYQDINPIQDMIFALISKDDNRFMVGDVKQSIYRFRNAHADIFLGYLRDFGDVASDGKNAKIFLSENYRSKKPILEFVNTLFDSLYTESTVGASYENERMICGSESTDAKTFPVEVAVFRDMENKTDAEVEYVSEKILSLVRDEGYSFGDIALLLRSPGGSAVEYKRAFLRKDIPFVIEKGGGFISEPEIQLALSVLRVMDDPYDDISLASSLRSPVFGFSADDLYYLKSRFAYGSLYDCVKQGNAYRIRHQNKGVSYKANKPYQSVTRKEYVFPPHGIRSYDRKCEEVYEKCASFIEKLRVLRAPGAECPSSRMIWNMYAQTHLVSLCAAEKNGKKRVKNLNRLYSIALDYEKTSLKGLSGFLSYIDDVSSSLDKNASDEVSDPDCVRILSLHASKGLEYPVCFVSSLGKQFNLDDTKKNHILTDDGFVYYDLRSAGGIAEYTPVVKLMAEEDERKAILREELRCLYVSLTRAKERLFVTGKIDGEAPEEVDFFASNDCMSWIYPIIAGKESPYYEMHEFSGDTETEKEECENKKPAVVPKETFYPYEVFASALENIPYDKNGCTVPSKASVSEMRKGILEDDEYTRTLSQSDARRKPVFASADSDSASKGTATHLFMQFADFGNTVKNGIKAETERLREIRMVSDTDISLMNVKELETFFRSGLCREIMTSDYVMREKRFNIIEDSVSFTSVKGEKVMVQGVIDCFFRTPDGNYTVVDYKTDRVSFADGEKVLTDRHSFQLGYYKRAVELITNGKVTRTLIYSFCLGKAIEVNL